MGQVCSSCDESFCGACSWCLGALVTVAGWPDFKSFETFEISSQHGPKHIDKLLTISSTVLSHCLGYYTKRSINVKFPVHQLVPLARRRHFRAPLLYMTLCPHNPYILTRLQIIARDQPGSALLACHLRFPPSIILQPQDC